MTRENSKSSPTDIDEGAFNHIGNHVVFGSRAGDIVKRRKSKKYKPTTNFNHKLPVSPNLLEQNFDVEAPNMVWVSDFKYIQTESGWQCLATVIDLYSRRVVGWSLSNRMTKQMVIDAMKMAIKASQKMD